MRSFITALQFLTRLHICDLPDLTAEDFGRSTRYFPLVGLVLGILQCLIAWLLIAFMGWTPFTTAVLLLVPLALTGGLHADGFMDTMDGLLSCRDRARMLEIMKDSRVGSYGVLALISLLLLEWGMLQTMQPMTAWLAVFTMPIIGRMAMVLAVGCFPYARPEGMGKIFAEMAGRDTIAFAFFCTLLVLVPCGPMALLALSAGLCFAMLWCHHAAVKLGGLTGDVYGATELMTEGVALFVLMLVSHAGWSLHLLWK